MKTESAPVIRVSNFSKSYGDFAAVEDLSFDVRPGEIVGLVGANGAGKTTTLRAISGLVQATRGSVQVNGHDLTRAASQAKRALAYIPDAIYPYELLTVWEHLRFIALAYEVEHATARSEALLSELDLLGKRDQMAAALSRGMLQKLSLACAFLRQPRVIVLDEPLTGLDPRGIRSMKDSIRQRAADGTAFLLSSHLLGLVETLCDRVLILHRGRSMAFGGLEEVRQLAALPDGATLEDVFFAITEAPCGGEATGAAA